MSTVLTPSITAHLTHKRLIRNFYDRFENYLIQLIENLIRRYYLYPYLDWLLKDLGNLSVPPVQILSRCSELVLLNYDPVIDTPEQLPPNIIGVGGLQIKAPKPLSKVRNSKIG